MTDTLHVCFTMDVERVVSQSPTGGPRDWQIAEQGVRDYCGFLGERGFPVTLFIVPDAADAQAGLFRAATESGHECGLHIHPQSWRDNYLQPDQFDFLGGYAPAEQHAMLGEAKRQLEDALGQGCRVFRPGNFSANDQTFGVLESLGFRAGSVSQPGRHAPRVKASWRGAYRGVHRAHKDSRLTVGDLDFVEVPASTDTTRTDHWTGVGDGRFEDWDVPDILSVVKDSLAWQQKNESATRHLCFMTHNYVNYGGADAETPTRLPVLRGVLEAIPGIAAEYGLTPAGATISSLRQCYIAAAGGS